MRMGAAEEECTVVRADAVLFVWPFEFGREYLRQNSSAKADENRATALITFINGHQSAQVPLRRGLSGAWQIGGARCARRCPAAPRVLLRRRWGLTTVACTRPSPCWA